MTENRQTGLYLVAKRALDIVGSLIALIVGSPVLLLIAAAVKLDSPGPALYRGPRVGRGRETFTVFKFRTMFHGVDDAPHREYVKQLLRAGHAAESTAGMYKLTDDARVTRVGAVLRKWSLDEVPQLINVFRGEMSLVGPRPEVPYVLDEYEPEDFRRFDVLPGITGLWQVEGRARLSPRAMLQLDVEYANSCTLWGDILLLVKTIPAVIARIGSG